MCEPGIDLVQRQLLLWSINDRLQGAAQLTDGPNRADVHQNQVCSSLKDTEIDN